MPTFNASKSYENRRSTHLSPSLICIVRTPAYDLVLAPYQD